MPDWFISLGQFTLTVMMVLFLGSVAVSVVSVIYVILRELIRMKRGK